MVQTYNGDGIDRVGRNRVCATAIYFATLHIRQQHTHDGSRCDP